MPEDYQFFAQLPQMSDPLPEDSILSRTLLEKPEIKIILFSFAEGQELSQHTASVPAVIHFQKGKAHLTLGEDQHTAQPGTWIYLPAKMPHSIAAETRVEMILYLLGK